MNHIQFRDIPDDSCKIELIGTVISGFEVLFIMLCTLTHQYET